MNRVFKFRKCQKVWVIVSIICGPVLLEVERSFASDGAEHSLEARRRAPYKEVRTKNNHDPAVTRLLREKMEREHNEREQHRKLAEAKLEASRLASKTNAPGQKAGLSPKPTESPKSEKEKTAESSPKITGEQK